MGASLAMRSDEDFLKHYALRQIWRDCVGKELAFAWSHNMERVTFKCSRRVEKATSNNPQTGRVPRQHDGTLTTIIPTDMGSAQLFVTNPPPPSHQLNSGLVSVRQHQPSVHTKTSALRPHSSNGINSVQPVWFTLFDQIPIFVHPVSNGNMITSRQKRQASEDKDDAFKMFIQNMLDKEKRVKEQLSNYTCVMEELGVIDQDGELLLDSIKGNTSAADLPSEVKEKFITALDDCYRVTGCEAYTPHLAAANIQRAMSFMRCARHRQQAACIKAGFRSYLEENIAKKAGSRVVDLDAMVERVYYISVITSQEDDRTSCSKHPASTILQSASCSKCLAECIMQQMSCRVHHAANVLQSASCSKCLAECIMQQMSCRVHHAANVLQSASCSKTHRCVHGRASMRDDNQVEHLLRRR
ncbi:Pheromone/general odorant binding protein [Trinorchestia longiramus]|nr:Pheromone/general odorant binding protein [Trinorchestia longiramus]